MWPRILSALLLGLLLGSFLNVVIYRLPQMLQRCDSLHYNLAWPGSHCPACRCRLRWWQLIPLLGFLLLRGHCANCSRPIAWRYPLIELLTGGCFAFLAWRLESPLWWLGAGVFTALLICLAVIDYETGLLPDNLTMLLLWSGLLFQLHATVGQLPLAVMGAVAGYLGLWLLYWGYRLLRGREGLGYGDMKLLAALGAWLGWSPLPQVLLMSSLTGLLAGGILMLSGRLARDDPMPFGPFLAVSGWWVWVSSVCF